MCGIAGYTHYRRACDPERIRSATLELLHRGPDQQGFYESATVSLGAARLKIVDLQGGDQPVMSERPPAVVVYNGEIYNHAELRRQLEQLGHRFRSRCDTEVLLRAFLQWDTACFERLRGMFAAAIWLERDRRLVLVRDRLGIKPLYYHVRGPDLYFGSELKAVFAHPEIERRLDLEGLDHYLTFNYVPCPYTLVEGIRKLPPGCWLEWREGRIRLERYWQLEFRPVRRSLGEACEELDALLREAVREHLISDVPLGVWASGGLDSSTILHYASELSGRPLKTFSISFRGRRFDESRYFREVAARYRTEHAELDLNESLDLASAIERMVWHSDEPSADAGAVPVWFLSELSRRSVTVALSGEGADELFGGYVTYLADGWARRLRWLPRAARRLALHLLAAWPVSDDKISLEYKLKRFVAGSLLDPGAAHCYWNGAFSPREKTAFYRGPRAAPLRVAVPELARRIGYLNQFLLFDQLHYLPDDILYKVDRMSMAHSLEVRPAFLDHRIVEFAASLPEDFKIRRGRLKYVLRELMKDRLPPVVIHRAKEGLDIPAHQWLRTVLRPLLLDTLTPAAVRDTGLFVPAAVEAMVRRHLERRANLGFQLWGLLILFLWARKFRIQTPGRSVREPVPLAVGSSARLPA
ncbi:MAG: asparagine synthase (glutamine-hydrolyzing) [Bryobacterales bacterium]|nr:asparagine synthase (glutamine-hydrolyzing) [Bryobacteraceae bacterium]MDW8131584.1 asparagine synthase (glutamine-hydrolyzing) [Bryobacterales bacterium]